MILDTLYALGGLAIILYLGVLLGLFIYWSSIVCTEIFLVTKKEKQMKEKCINIVFTGMPGPGDGCVFVEVEDNNGKSISVGKWRERVDGFVELHITEANIQSVE